MFISLDNDSGVTPAPASGAGDSGGSGDSPGGAGRPPGSVPPSAGTPAGSPSFLP